MVVLIPAIPILPGLGTFVLASLGVGILYLLCWPTRGPIIMHSSPEVLQGTTAGRWEDERWIFVNGTMVPYVLFLVEELVSNLLTGN